MNSTSLNFRKLWQPVLFMLISVCFSLPKVSGQVSVTKTKFHGRDAYALENDRMRLSVLTGGGYIAEARLKSSDGKEMINPMRVPHYQTIDPQDYNPMKHDSLYGVRGDRILMAGYMGHFLCFPYLGGTNSKFEQELGFGAHGEAVYVKWDIEQRASDGHKAGILSSANLPLSRYHVSRNLTMYNGHPVVLVEEEIENLEGFDRPYQWVQHITFGNPFIDFGKTFVDAPVSRIAFNENKDDSSNINTVQWPMVKTITGNSFDVGLFNTDKEEGFYRAWFMDPERTHTWFTMYNKEFSLLIGYIFSKEENPWIGDWQENGFKKHAPWDGKAVAWGLEVGTSPFTSGVKRSIERGPIFETRTYRWIGAKEKKKQSYMIFLLEIDDNFKGVEELKLEEGAIVLIENETAKQIRIASNFPF